MSNIEDTREIAVFRKCPDCGFSNMRVFTNGGYSCGACCGAGLINTFTHKHLLKDKEIIKKVKNDYVFSKIHEK